jgi:hypothetical protein
MIHRCRWADEIRLRPSGVFGPVLMPPWLRQRPPLPTPRRLHGSPVRVLAAHLRMALFGQLKRPTRGKVLLLRAHDART